MTEIVVTTEDEFDSIEATDFIILFTAPAWCVPCRRFEPHWNKAVETLDNMTFVKIDMGESPEATGEHWASTRFGIRGVPQVKRVTISGDDTQVVDIKARAVVPFIKEVTGG